MSNTSYTLTSRAAGRRLGVSDETIRRWANAGKLRHVVLPSGQMRFSEAELDLILTPVEPTVATGPAGERYLTDEPS